MWTACERVRLQYICMWKRWRGCRQKEGHRGIRWRRGGDDGLNKCYSVLLWLCRPLPHRSGCAAMACRFPPEKRQSKADPPSFALLPNCLPPPLLIGKLAQTGWKITPAKRRSNLFFPLFCKTIECPSRVGRRRGGGQGCGPQWGTQPIAASIS